MVAKHRKRVFAAAAGASILAAVAFAYARPSEAQRQLPATAHLSIFERAGGAADPATATEIAFRARNLNADLTKLRVVGRGLGRLNTTLAIFPARENQNMCYTTIGSDSTGSGLLYCYTPRGADAPAETAGARFNVMKMYTAAGGPHTDVFGVAFDDVKSLRVQVSGEWRAIPIFSNGFFLEAPGAAFGDVGIVEATLADGSVQRWDTRTGGLVG